MIIERESPSVPFRTRQGNPVSPMVLWLKPRKSRSSPELNSIRYKNRLNRPSASLALQRDSCGGFCFRINAQQTKRLKMKKILLIRLISSWPSLYNPKCASTVKGSALDQQREIVAAMLKTKRLVHTEPVQR